MKHAWRSFDVSNCSCFVRINHVISRESYHSNSKILFLIHEIIYSLIYTLFCLSSAAKSKSNIKRQYNPKYAANLIVDGENKFGKNGKASSRYVKRRQYICSKCKQLKTQGEPPTLLICNIAILTTIDVAVIMQCNFLNMMNP